MVTKEIVTKFIVQRSFTTSASKILIYVWYECFSWLHLCYKIFKNLDVVAVLLTVIEQRKQRILLTQLQYADRLEL